MLRLAGWPRWRPNENVRFGPSRNVRFPRRGVAREHDGWARTALKKAHPEYGSRRIRGVLKRFEAIGVFGRRCGRSAAKQELDEIAQRRRLLLEVLSGEGEIEVFGKACLRVRRDRPAADDEILNPGAFEFRQQIGQVGDRSIVALKTGACAPLPRLEPERHGNRPEWVAYQRQQYAGSTPFVWIRLNSVDGAASVATHGLDC
jgi:hypothetical protein